MRQIIQKSLAAFILLTMAGCTSQPIGRVAAASSGGMAPPPFLTVKPNGERQFSDDVASLVFFPFNKAELTRGAKVILSQQAAWLENHQVSSILIAGNADSRGGEGYNLALAERRASATRDYLVNLGVNPALIEVASYGKSCPIVAGEDARAWRENRNTITSVDGRDPQANCARANP